MRKNAQKVIAVGFLFLAFAFYLHTSSVKAAFPHNVTGQAWSTNIGWINFSCDSTNTCGSVDYGVDVDITNVITGRAWSNNIGWMSFDAVDLQNCSPAPCSATYDPISGNITGWARACGGTSSGACAGSGSRTDGWDGWIKLNSTTGVTYQAKLNPVAQPAGNGSGLAWGSDVVGWVDFTGVKYNPTPLSTPIVTTNAATSITSTSASISGFVNVNGSANVPLTLRMEWGTSASLSSYGTMNGNGSPISTGSINFSPFSIPSLSGLTPSTTYYYRMAAIGNDTTRYTGSILSFTTLPTVLTPTVTLLANGVAGASAVPTGTQVTLSWSGTNLKTGGNYCNISGSGNGTIPQTPVTSPSGSILGWAATNPPISTTTYQIWCYGTDGVTQSNTSTATVTINPVPVLCVAPALNAGSPPPCQYAAGICADANAQNVGSPLPCTYASGICEDPTAINAGQPMPCKYRSKPKWWEF